jgi:hypothetical protein
MLGFAAIMATAAVIRPSAFDEPVPPPAKVKTVVKTQVKTVKVVETRHLPAGKPPDGYISRDECFGIPENMTMQDFMYRFGWPAGRNGRAMGLGDADYPIREDHDAFCTVRFPYGKVSSVTYHENRDDYGGTDAWPGTD